MSTGPRDNASRTPEPEGGSPSEARDGTRCGRPLKDVSDPELLDAIRAFDPDAILEFFARFESVLTNVAARARVPAGLRAECVSDFLGDMVMRIAERRLGRTRSLVGYLVVSMRNRLQNERVLLARQGRREREAMEAASRNDGAVAEGVMMTLASEYARRAAEMPGADGSDPRDPSERDDGEREMHPAAQGLIAALDAEMSDEERQIMSWLTAGARKRDIADRIGMKHGSFRMRVIRLVARLALAVERYEAELSEADRAVVRRLHPGVIMNVAGDVAGPRSRHSARKGAGGVAPATELDDGDNRGTPPENEGGRSDS